MGRERLRLPVRVDGRRRREPANSLRDFSCGPISGHSLPAPHLCPRPPFRKRPITQHVRSPSSSTLAHLDHTYWQQASPSERKGSHCQRALCPLSPALGAHGEHTSCPRTRSCPAPPASGAVPAFPHTVPSASSAPGTNQAEEALNHLLTRSRPPRNRHLKRVSDQAPRGLGH